MDPSLNPYVPGAGRPPAALVGRDVQLRAWESAQVRLEKGLSAQPLVFYGLRGVGKTVLLNSLARDSEARSWLVAQVEAGAGKSLRRSLGEALYGPLSDLARPSAGRRLVRALKTALSFKASYDASGTWTFGVNLDPDAPGGGADSGVLETDLEKLLKDLSAAAAEEGVGLAVLVDEAQDLTPEEMVALCSTAHKASQQSWPALFCLAGLPSLPKDLATAKSYAERLFDYHHVTSLSDVAAAEAIIEPAKAMGVAWEEAAVDLLIRKTRGYPYFIQQYGQETWNEARGDHTITLIDAQYGVEHGQRQLDYGFFRARWDRATPGEQQYLRAMCIDGDAGSNSRDIAKRMDRKHSALGPTRSRLISKGLIYAPEYGRVEFTVPGMAAFVSRQNNE